MLLGGAILALAGEHIKGADQTLTGLIGFDHVVDVTEAGGYIGSSGHLGVLGSLLLLHSHGILGTFDILAEDDVGGTVGAHNGDLGGGPGQNHVGTQVFGAHSQIGAAVSLAGDHGHLGHGGFAVGVQHLGAVADDAAELLSGAGQEAGNVHQSQNGYVEAVAGTDKAGGFVRGVDVQTAGLNLGLVGDDAHTAAVQTHEAADHVGSKVGLILQEFAAVGQSGDERHHIVSTVGAFGDQLIQLGQQGVGIHRRGRCSGHLQIVLGQVAEQIAHAVEAGLLGLVVEMCHAGGLVVSHGAAQFLGGNLLAGDGGDDLRAGDEHLTHALYHEDEVGQRGGVGRAAGAGADDDGDLGDNARCDGVVEEDLSVARQSVHALLNTGTAGIVNTNQRCSDLQSCLLAVDDFLGVHQTQTAADDGEVLGEDVNQSAVDRAVAGHYAVAVHLLLFHAKVGASVLSKGIQFYKTVGVQ